jgi:hypothetical protein
VLSYTKQPNAGVALAGLSESEGTRYVFNQGGHELWISRRGLSDAQIRAFSHDEAEFALLVEEPVIVLCCRFGNELPWSFASYCWHLVPRLQRALPPSCYSTDNPVIVHAGLIEAETGTLHATREIVLPIAFSRALSEAIGDQARMTFDPRAQERAMSEFERRFSLIGAVLARAVARTVVMPE